MKKITNSRQIFQEVIILMMQLEMRMHQTLIHHRYCMSNVDITCVAGQFYIVKLSRSICFFFTILFQIEKYGAVGDMLINNFGFNEQPFDNKLKQTQEIIDVRSTFVIIYRIKHKSTKHGHN